jgi:hypothetical protein
VLEDLEPLFDLSGPTETHSSSDQGPAEPSTAHNDLVSVLDDGIAAVSAAYERFLDAESCSLGCYDKDTPGGQKFRSESSRITEAFGVAVEQCERDLVQAVAAAENTRLPKQPAV